MESEKIVPVILCGGIGTRLWPLSRESFPKQFINLDDNNEKTLIQNTYQRLLPLKNLDKPILICNEEHRFIAAEQLREINVTPKTILLEPIGKGTAPAITLSALKAVENSQNPYLLILSSDHFIKNQSNFVESINAGIKYAKEGRLVTFGVLPKSPETEYGYIEAESPLSENLIGYKISKFIEKPDYKKAKEFYANKRFTWNSGIFIFKAQEILTEIKKYQPEILELCRKSLINNSLDLDFQRVNKKFFLKCPNLSLDVGIMEKTKLGTVLPLNVGWSDIGSWQSLWQSSKKDTNNNHIKGNVFLKDCQENYLKSEERLIVGVGISNLVVIETMDAVLVLNKNRSQEMKEVVKQMKDKKFNECFAHKKIFRPWGHYNSLIEGKNWKVKKIVVNPHSSLSLQLHHERSEHWVVVSGVAKVEINEKVNFLKENESAFVPIKTKHRISNPEKNHLILIEVQSGSKIDELDIVRFEDNYGRIKKA